MNWAKEYPLDESVRLVVHLQNSQLGADAHGKADLTQRELRQLFRAGRISLMIGLSFLALCVSGAPTPMARERVWSPEGTGS